MAAAQASAPADVVRQFHAAIGRGDISAARSLLADDLHFRGPIDEFHRSDDYLAALGKLSAIVKGMDNLRIVADGEHVAAFYDLVTNTPAGASPTAELHTVRGGKIRQIQVYFDARPFAAMFAKK
jgi:ketosteroid isomerase-like protein